MTKGLWRGSIKRYLGASTDGEALRMHAEWVCKQIDNKNISKVAQKCMAKTYQLTTKHYFGASIGGGTWFGNGDVMEDDSVGTWENVHMMLMRTGVTWQRSLQRMAEDQLKCSQRWSIHLWMWQELSHSGGVSKTHSFIQRNHVSRPWEPPKTGAKGDFPQWALSQCIY